MLLTRSQFIDKLAAAGIPTASMTLFAPDAINGVEFGSVSDEFVAASWRAWLDMLLANAPALVISWDVGGGLTRRGPRYVVPGFVCRHHAICFHAHLLIGLALRAAQGAQAFDGYLLGFFNYTAEPRAENRFRTGRHTRHFYLNDAGALKFFEEGDGEVEPLTPAEIASITSFSAE